MLAVAFLFVSLASCERHAPAPSASASPASPRIVALSPAVAASLRELGLAGHLVGRHGYDAWSDPALPVCGDQSGVDYETLLRVRPTHVLVQWGKRQMPSRLVELAAAHHWHIETLDPLTLDGVIDSGRSLARLFAQASPPPATAAVDRLEDSCAPIDRLNAGHVGRVALLDWTSAPPGSYALLGPGSFHQQMLERLGATPAFTDDAPYFIMDQEDLLHLAPDAVIVFIPAAPDHSAANVSQGREQGGRPPVFDGPLVDEVRRRLDGITGGSTQGPVRVAVIDDPESLLPGLNLARTAEQMRAILSRWSDESALNPSRSP